MSYDPYGPHDGEQSAETAGHAGFLDWLAARFDALVQQAKNPDNWEPKLYAREVKPYPYELAACAERIRDLEATLLKTLREWEKVGNPPYELHKEIVRLLRTPAECRKWEKEETAKFKLQERARERGLLKTLSPEEKKRYRAQKEFRRRLFSGED
jgi:hypothetical protein